jgi:arylsulfatase
MSPRRSIERWTGLFLVGSALLLAACTSEPESSPGRESPNIVFILADDLGYSDISPYGSEVETPHLQRLADGGMRFTLMHNTSKCFPSRAELLTGTYAQQSHMHDRPGAFEHSVMLGEVLNRAGYRTLFVGKHHGTDNPSNWGFDHYWGLRDGAANYFNPGEKRSSDPGEPAQKDWAYPRTFVFDDSVAAPFTPEKGYYGTDTWTDWALELLGRYEEEPKPFFLYLSYQAPHDPLQAPEETIEKYEGTYDEGYGAIRKARYNRLVESGLIDKETFPLSESTHRDWDALSPEEREDQARRMEVYAAMIDRMDQNIGRLLDYLREQDKLDNTLIMFASDNGASAEVVRIGEGPIGSMTRWASLQKDWANVANTPFRRYKNDSYQGGVATPFIVHWPGVVEPGSTTDYVGKFIDIMPTLVDLTGGTYPDTYKGDSVVAMQGRSLLPILEGGGAKRAGPIFNEWDGGKSIYRDGWKLVQDRDTSRWELYHLREDRSETNNLAEERPDLVEDLAARWERWYDRTAQYRSSE